VSGISTRKRMTKKPFIMRFQEFCLEPCIARPETGTQTATHVRTEAADSDLPRRKHEAFAAGISSGTQTMTFVMAEGDDKDPQKPKHTAFDAGPKDNTMSITAVHAEAVDQDTAASAALAFPKEKSAISAGTQTQTRIQAEQSDEDRGRKEFEAIPQCSLS
jgi:hypothetical protein